MKTFNSIKLFDNFVDENENIIEDIYNNYTSTYSGVATVCESIINNKNLYENSYDIDGELIMQKRLTNFELFDIAIYNCCGKHATRKSIENMISKINEYKKTDDFKEIYLGGIR